jgi:hypothetical protein
MKDEKQSETRERLRKNNLSGATCTSPPPSITWTNTGKQVGVPNYLEARQGSCNDCYFLAALIAIAYRASGLLKVFPNYQFYDTIGKAWSPSFKVDQDLAVDSSNPNKLVYAWTTSDKIWLGLYEKAYAMWANNNLTNNHPNMSKICGGGNALNALQQITSKAPISGWPSFPGGVPQYPTVVDTNSTASTLTPSHAYVVVKYSGGLYYLFNPCGGSPATISNTNDLSDWGYIK